MALSFIQLISVTGAVILLIVILLVAAIIGYLTGWFYAKSIYKPVIKGLEEDRETLLKDLSEAKTDVEKLNGRVDELNQKISKLEEEIKNKDKELDKLKNK